VSARGDPVRYASGVKGVAVRLTVAAALVAGIAVVAFLTGRATAPGDAPARPSIRATPGVVTAIHDVARLEATVFHIEKVIEATEQQTRLWGFVRAKDALLLVAVGDVVAGVDFGKVRPEDVRADGATRSIYVRLPAPDIISSTLDERATHVYSRSTDTLAARNEQLEGQARLTAEETMRKAAVDAGVLERARASADRTVRALLHSFGYDRVDIDWADRG
jgi:Protein of unknown function (DUF4230)